MSEYKKLLNLLYSKQEFGVGNPYNNDFVTNEDLAKYLIENGATMSEPIPEKYRKRGNRK